MRKLHLLFMLVFILSFCLPQSAKGQGFSLPEGKDVEKVRFELINNLIIIPIEVNGAKLSFILDSGVSTPILFNVSDQDSVFLKNVSEITIRGLGDGDPIKALSSKGNSFKLKNIKNSNQNLYVVMDKEMNFSPTLGMPIHGIIGYDLFRDFVVDINYNSGLIKFYNPDEYVPKKYKDEEQLPLIIQKNKAYVQGNVDLNDKKDVPVNLLIDTGSSDAVWLFPDKYKGLDVPEKYYDDYLGKGLSGTIFGKRTKVKSIRLGSYRLKDAKTAFPNMDAFGNDVDLGNRNGSIGGELLRRFNITVDYSTNEIRLRKNAYFKKPFQYNMSGLQIKHNGLRYIADRIADKRGVVHSSQKSFGDVQILMEGSTRLSLVPEIVVSAIRVGSPAEVAGLKEGDIILAVNGKKVHSYKLQEVLKMMNEKEGKRIRVLIERYNKDLLFSFVLKKVFE